MVGNNTTNPLQEVDYTYNIRGWLKGINNHNSINPNELITFGAEDLFGFQINYNSPFNFGVGENPDPLFNGNISQILWKTASINTTSNPVSERYSYAYDALNRILAAQDNTGNYSLSGLAYDKNGNINSLQRQGHLNDSPTNTSFGIMDNLDYVYVGNKLQKVTDGSLVSEGFDDQIAGSVDYRYDENGNLLSDLNKFIGDTSTDGISYNHLNLPTNITISGGGNDGSIDYIYDATGMKIQKILNDTGQSSVTTTDYAGNYIYDNGQLAFFSHQEGYVYKDGTGEFKYVYQYKDHLNNVRLSYTEDPSNPGQATIIQENNYYPFGGKHMGYNIGGDNSLGNDLAQKWKFGGKELDDSFEGALSTYDFGARNYDPWIGRWMNIDPLAEQMRRHSPYNYAFDNPIFFIDPDGMKPQGCCFPTDIGEGIARSFRETFGPDSKIGKAINTATAVALAPVAMALNELNPKDGGYVLTGNKETGRKKSISDMPDRKAPGDAESLDVSTAVELQNVYGPQLDSKAEGVKLGAELLKMTVDGSDKGNSSDSNNGTIIETGNEEVSPDIDVREQYTAQGTYKRVYRSDGNGTQTNMEGVTHSENTTSDIEQAKNDSARLAKDRFLTKIRIKRDTTY